MTTGELAAVIKKNPISVGCGVLCIALGAGIYFRGSLIPEAEAELTQKTAEADRYATNIKNSTQLKEQFETLVAANKEIDSRIIRASQLAVNYQYIFKIVAESGVKLIDQRQGSIGSGAKTGKNAFSPVTYSVSIQGDMSQVMHFLALLESGARYIRVLTATCTVPGNDRAGPLTLNLSFEILGVP
jgi:hypothetical protein